jgi:hypothetical protein
MTLEDVADAVAAFVQEHLDDLYAEFDANGERIACIAPVCGGRGLSQEAIAQFPLDDGDERAAEIHDFIHEFHLTQAAMSVHIQSDLFPDGISALVVAATNGQRLSARTALLEGGIQEKGFRMIQDPDVPVAQQRQMLMSSDVRSELAAMIEGIRCELSRNQ